MIRRAFRMRLNDGKADEYSIFLDPQAHELFAYVEFESIERWEAVARTDVCQRWWQHMREIMPSNPDNSPVSRECREVFHLDARR
jgi:L-rhamnose mutarotase